MLKKYDIKNKTENFDCGLKAVNFFLHKKAKEHTKKKYNCTYVLLQNEDIIAYYTLQAFSLNKDFLSSYIKTSLPNQLPIFRICMLGVTKQQQRKGIGENLILDAIAKTKEMQKNLGTIGLYLDSDPQAINLYQRCGFVNLTPIQQDKETPMILTF